MALEAGISHFKRDLFLRLAAIASEGRDPPCGSTAPGNTWIGGHFADRHLSADLRRRLRGV